MSEPPNEMVGRLRQRREQILEQLGGSDLSSFPTNPAVRALTAELATIESALVQAENTRVLQADAAAREQARASADDSSFWFRRFMLSLQVGNGAAMLAALSASLQADDPARALRLASAPTDAFGLGVIFAGALPAFLWMERAWPQARTPARVLIAVLTLASAAAFLYGVGRIQGMMSALVGHS